MAGRAPEIENDASIFNDRESMLTFFSKIVSSFSSFIIHFHMKKVLSYHTLLLKIGKRLSTKTKKKKGIAFVKS